MFLIINMLLLLIISLLLHYCRISVYLFDSTFERFETHAGNTRLIIKQWNNIVPRGYIAITRRYNPSRMYPVY